MNLNKYHLSNIALAAHSMRNSKDKKEAKRCIKKYLFPYSKNKLYRKILKQILKEDYKNIFY